MSASVLLVRALVEAVEAAGVVRERLLEAARFDGARLADVDGRLSLAELDTLHEAALDLTGDPALGLHLGERATAPAYDMVAYLTSQAATLREGIDGFLRFRLILSEGPPSRLVEEGDAATLEIGLADAPPRCARLRAELAMTGFLRLLRQFGGDTATARNVLFVHSAPEYRAEYTRIFGGVERFSRPVTAIRFDRELLDREVLHKNEGLHAMLVGEAERKLHRLTRGACCSDRVRDLLVSCAPRQWRDMSWAAGRLGMSARSLRRRLSEEGSSYPDLVGEAQAEAAKRLLDDPHRSIHETAYDMGFSEPSAFHRAFKRWTGMSPKRYRETR